jgi:hypothetical protein
MMGSPAGRLDTQHLHREYLRDRRDILDLTAEVNRSRCIGHGLLSYLKANDGFSLHVCLPWSPKYYYTPSVMHRSSVKKDLYKHVYAINK